MTLIGWVIVSFPINLFPEKIYLKIKHTYIKIKFNASYEGNCVEFEKKSNTTLVFLLSNCLQEQTNLLKPTP